MAINNGDTVVCLPPHLDTYLQKSIFHMLAEPCSCQRHLEVKLAEAVDSQRQMQNQVHVLLRRLEEAEAKCAKSRVRKLRNHFAFNLFVSVLSSRFQLSHLS